MDNDIVGGNGSNGDDCNGRFAVMACDNHKTADDTTSSSCSNQNQKKKAHKKRKASKGRFKKLWRRAVGPPPGITTRSEWLELAAFHSDWKLQQEGKDQANANDGCTTTDKYERPTGGGVATDKDAMQGPLPGPSIVISTQKKQSDFSQLDDWQTTEVSDHRDILINLLFGEGDNVNSTSQQPKKKKRKLSSDDAEKCNSKRNSMVSIPPLPSWSSISNIASNTGVAVIQIEINGGDTVTPCPILPSQRIMDDTPSIWHSLIQSCGNDKVKRTIGSACKVNLFQGEKNPRCMSEIMFLPPSPACTNAKQVNGNFDLYSAMNDLKLKSKQLRSERFPTEACTSVSDETSVIWEKIHATTSSKQNALELVGSLSVNVAQDEDDIVNKLDDVSKLEHWVKSFSHPSSSENSSEKKPKIFAIDCEMVKSLSAQPELARVSVIKFTADENVDEKTTVVLDELVKPRRKVLDYLTQYSGISANMLTNIETRIEDIQVRLLSMIDENDILVGHSLENDLRALRFIHRNIIDTSVIFRGSNGRKFSLKHLSNVLLQKKIQNGCGTTGHSSIEDAEAALLLAIRRARRGPAFRLKENSQRQHILSVFQKINRTASAESNKDDLECFAERNDGPCVCIGDSPWISKYAQTADGAHHVLSCESILNSMSMAVPSWLSSEKTSKRAGFLWANLKCEGKWMDEVKKFDEVLKALVDRVPLNIPILLMYQHNYQKASNLSQQRTAARNPKAISQWTSQQEEEWKEYMTQCRRGEAIWIGTSCPSP